MYVYIDLRIYIYIYIYIYTYIYIICICAVRMGCEQDFYGDAGTHRLDAVRPGCETMSVGEGENDIMWV